LTFFPRQWAEVLPPKLSPPDPGVCTPLYFFDVNLPPPSQSWGVYPPLTSPFLFFFLYTKRFPMVASCEQFPPDLPCALNRALGTLLLFKVSQYPLVLDEHLPLVGFVFIFPQPGFPHCSSLILLAKDFYSFFFLSPRNARPVPSGHNPLYVML